MAKCSRARKRLASPGPFLSRLGGATGKSVYLESALRAAEFCWDSGGDQHGCFAGATLDNPDVVDKEAAIFALEGFLELHRATGDTVWLNRAITAASMAETWIYAWDLAMPVDADEAELDWKPGISTVGMQLIATGCIDLRWLHGHERGGFRPSLLPHW